MHNRAVVFLMGTTTAGKTDLAASLYDAYDAELVSVDAAQVYRGMDLGTAKPNAAFLRKYPHHLLDIRAPDETYSAAQFRQHALTLICQIHRRGKLPILVGGTMFYFSALEHGLSELPPADHESRTRIAHEIKQHGLPAVYAQLQRVDPQLATAISPTDSYRIQRALEIHRLTALPPSVAMAQSSIQPLPFPLLKLGLFIPDRRILHARIEARFKQMVANGLVEEVKTIAAGLERADEQPSMRMVGYRQVHAYLRGETTHADMIQQGIAATRQLAKRQLTWMRQMRNLVWVDATNPAAAADVKLYLQNWEAK